jgi:hypothetical protein
VSQELELITKIYTFYSGRYTDKTLEERFNNACFDLVKTGDINHATYIEFCVDHNIEPYIEPPAPARQELVVQPTYRYQDDGCGGGGRNYSGC